MSIDQVVFSGGWPLAVDVLSEISHSSSQGEETKEAVIVMLIAILNTLMSANN